jgi:hypothetical protein
MKINTWWIVDIKLLKERELIFMDKETKVYVAPSIEIVEFEIEDSIAVSGDMGGAAYSEWIFE